MENKSKKFRFNIIDAVVIVVIIAVVAFFAVKFIDKSEMSASSTTSVSYVVEISAMPKEEYEEIAAQLPAQMIANGAYIDGWINSAEATPCEVSDIEVSDTGNKNAVYHVNPQGEYVTVRFYCEGTTKGDVLNTIGSQEIRVGRANYIKSDDIEVAGTIISMEPSTAQQ